ncbi:MAG: hypothetical protein WD876_01230 [Candidatus Pacearchaeota archaeon]
MQKGKLIHCNGIVQCEESLQPGYRQENGIDIGSFRNIFFKDFELDYILDFSLEKGIHFHIATHSEATSTCEDKARITGLPLERVIKGYYLQDLKNGKVYALTIPGNRKYDKNKITEFLGIPQKESASRLVRSRWLPMHIEEGTVHPFVNSTDFNGKHDGGKLEAILFDGIFSEKRKKEGGLDDFSITTHPSTGYDNHRISIQINYNDALEILKENFSNRVQVTNLV